MIRFVLRHRFGTAATVATIVIAAAVGVAAHREGATFGLTAFGRGAHPADGAPPASVAVLPFKAVGGTADNAYAESFTRELTAALGRSLLGSPVASYNAAAGTRNKAFDAREFGRDLKVRYLLEGEVQRTGDQTAVNLLLFDAGEARQIWSKRIDASASELPDLPDLLVIRSTFATRLALFAAESHRLAQRSASGASAAELVLRAWLDYGNDTSFETATKSKDLCDRAIAADPGLASARWCKAMMIVESLDLRPSPMRDQLAAEADNLTRLAVQLDPDDAFAWRVRGEALRYQHQWDSALEANQKAIRLDPTRTSNLAVRGLYMIWTGRPEAALPLVERSMKISTDNLGFDERVACRAYISLGRFKDAVTACERSVVEDEFWSIHLYLAVAYAQAGETAKAAAELKRAKARKPEATIAWYRELLSQITDNALYWQQHDAYFEPGLRKAGLPEK
jgi:TolB-like protein